MDVMGDMPWASPRKMPERMEEQHATEESDNTKYFYGSDKAYEVAF
jgi:hypothetical protein